MLGIAIGSEVCIRESIMRGDDEVLQLSTKYFPRALTVGTDIERRHVRQGGIYMRLKEAGHEITRRTEQVSFSYATDHEAQRMNLNPGDPLFRMQRITWGSSHAIEIDDIIATVNQYRLLYELPGS